MKPIISCILVILMTVAVAHGRQGKGRERIHAAKVTYIADRIQLKDSQSGYFVPLYNEYEQELRSVRKLYFRKYKARNEDKGEHASIRQQVEDDLDYQQDVIALKRKYNDRFLKVISSKQLSDMYIAEREFRQILVQRLKQKKAKMQHRK